MSSFSLNVLIVEDDLSLGLDLEIMLKDIGYSILGIAESSGKAARFIEKQNPDLILMDINIKGNLSGIELAENLRHLNIPILFITGYNLDKNFELASQVNHIGFLVKPIQKYTLQSAIEQAFNKLGEVKGSEKVFPIKKSMLFNKLGVLHRINIPDINYIKASDDYTITYTCAGEFVNSVRLFEMEEELRPFGFVKCHRSYLVNPDKVSSFDVHKSEIAIGNISIPVSRKHKNDVVESLDIVKRRRK